VSIKSSGDEREEPHCLTVFRGFEKKLYLSPEKKNKNH